MLYHAFYGRTSIFNQGHYKHYTTDSIHAFSFWRVTCHTYHRKHTNTSNAFCQQGQKASQQGSQYRRGLVLVLMTFR